MPAMQVHLRLPEPLGLQVLDVPDSMTIGTLLPDWASWGYLRTRSSGPLDLDTPLKALAHAEDPSHPIDLELCARLRGGKGGFGSQLRAAGGRMSAGKSTNLDSCRDLNGRRLGSIKDAQKQAELMESVPTLKAKASAEEKARLEALERKLGVSSTDIDSAPGEGSKRLAEVDLDELARKKHKFDDNKFIEESREINENVRSAVGAALLKKRKKKAAAAGTGAAKTVAAAKKVEKDAAKMPPPKVGTTAA